MASDFFTASELIAVVTVYCVVFCPVLCWAIGRSAPETKELSATSPAILQR